MNCPSEGAETRLPPTPTASDLRQFSMQAASETKLFAFPGVKGWVVNDWYDIANSTRTYPDNLHI